MIPLNLSKIKRPSFFTPGRRSFLAPLSALASTLPQMSKKTPARSKTKPAAPKARSSSEPRYWLLKSDTASYTIADLKRDKRTSWDGVRNYQARNFMRDDMNVGDLVLFYHSGESADGPGVAGIARICKTAYTDHHAWDPTTCDYDPKASPDNPIWLMVDVEFVEQFPTFIPLATLRADPKLNGMLLLKRGMRLSVQPVDQSHFDHILKLGRKKH